MTTIFHVIFTLFMLGLLYVFQFNLPLHSIMLAFTTGVLIDVDHIPAYWVFSGQSFTLNLSTIYTWYLRNRPILPFVFFHSPLIALIVSITLLQIGETVALITYAIHLLFDQLSILYWK